ncbi:hypothetical protein [Spirosoma litoris]
MKTTRILLMLLVGTNVLGQQPAVVKNAWRAAIFSPGIMYETRLANRFTLISEARITSNMQTKDVHDASTDKTTYYSSYSINPILSVGVRHFYNFDRRLEKGKSIRSNSGNYLSVRTRYALPAVAKDESEQVPIGDGSGFGVDALWGFQRTYRRNFYLNLALGASIFSGKATGAADFTLGYTFPSN